MEVTKVWEFVHPDSLYTPSIGGVQRLPNGNTLVTYTTLSKIVEVSSDLDIVWSYSHPPEQTEYLCRADKYSDIFDIGDMNYDFIINILDVINISNLILNGYDYNYLADINIDGLIDILDVISIINIIIDN